MKKEVLPGVVIETLSVGENLMTVKGILSKDSTVPNHSHPYEQTSFIHRGKLKYTVNGKDIIMNEGDSLIIKPNEEHSCVALEDTEDINTFFPIRKDYL
ncbi:MAG: hypothetical protein HPY66_3110 [Firmicutes bacterium]|nr:hypothetical protein [Bacillota bacterium]